MFNLQGSELVIILLLALVVLGPEKLPDAMRKLGQFYAQMKKMSTGFQQEFKAAVDQPMKEVRDTANLLRDSIDFRNFQDGVRDEKPKSGDMAAVTPNAAAPESPPVVAPASERTPSDDVPFQEPRPSEGQAVDVPVESIVAEPTVAESVEGEEPGTVLRTEPGTSRDEDDEW